MTHQQTPTMLRAAMVSYPVALGDVDANRRVIETTLAAHDGIDLFVFPELCLCGNLPPTIEAMSRVAEAVPAGPSAQHMIALAQRYQTVLCAGIIEVEDGAYYATHFLCGPQGYLGKQRKLFPSRGVPHTGDLSGGRNVTQIELFGVGCAILACADWMLPEGPYLASLQDVALILAPTDRYESSRMDLLCQIGQARVFDSHACLAVAFGRDASCHDDAPTGLVVHADSTVQMEACADSAVQVMVSELCLQPPLHRWGRPVDRVTTVWEVIGGSHDR
jgi:predicted amidohydrolase